MPFQKGNKVNLGRKLSSEIKAKISSSLSGKIPWNKGLKVDREKYPTMGAFGKRTLEQKKRISDGHKGQKAWNKGTGEWTGTDNEYRLLHKWVERRLGKPMCCDFCKKTNLGMYHWANKSGKYKKEITDWLRLCQKCHAEYDNKRRSR